MQIDFAHGYIGSPGIDIAHLLFTSSHSSLRELEWDKLIQYYHEELCNMLRELSYPKKLPTLREIRRQVDTSSLYTAFIGILEQNHRAFEINSTELNVIALFFAPVTVEGAFEKRKKALSMPKAAAMTKYLIEYYDRKGYFN